MATQKLLLVIFLVAISMEANVCLAWRWLRAPSPASLPRLLSRPHCPPLSSAQLAPVPPVPTLPKPMSLPPLSLLKPAPLPMPRPRFPEATLPPFPSSFKFPERPTIPATLPPLPSIRPENLVFPSSPALYTPTTPPPITKP